MKIQNSDDSRAIQAARTAKFIKKQMWSGFWNGGGLYAGFYLAFNHQHELSMSIAGLMMFVAGIFMFKSSLKQIDAQFTGSPPT